MPCGYYIFFLIEQDFCVSFMVKLSVSIREGSYEYKTHVLPLDPVSNFCNTINPFVFISSFCKHFSI